MAAGCGAKLALLCLPLPLGRATPDRASSTELLPELWSPMTAMAGRARSCSTPRARRESMRSMQGRTFSSYWLYRLFSGPWKGQGRLSALRQGSHHPGASVAESVHLLMVGGREEGGKEALGVPRGGLCTLLLWQLCFC